MQVPFRVLEKAFFFDRLVYPDDIVYADEDFAPRMGSAYERIADPASVEDASTAPAGAKDLPPMPLLNARRRRREI